MRPILYVIGVAAITVGGYLLIITGASHTGRWPEYCDGAFIVLCGVAYFVAGLLNYRGHWAFVIGVALLYMGSHGFIFELDSILLVNTWSYDSHDITLGALLVFALTTFGILSLWSGQKLHQCQKELERIKKGEVGEAERGVLRAPRKER